MYTSQGISNDEINVNTSPNLSSHRRIPSDTGFNILLIVKRIK